VSTIRPVGLGYAGYIESIFEVRYADEGEYIARAPGYSAFTRGDDRDELRANVIEATELHFEDESGQPGMVQLHRGKDELFPGCAVVLQKGSYIRLAHPGPPDRRITIPGHKP
jgi:predicted RNase H-like HicB family nuclease